MAVLDVGVNQVVRIPDLQCQDGKILTGRVKSYDGTSLVVTHQALVKGNGNIKDRTFLMTWEVGEQTRSCPILINDLAEGELTCQIVISERRESLRIRCDVGLTFSPIDEEELAGLADEIMSRLNPIVEAESETESLMRSTDPEDALRMEVVMIRRLLERLTNQVEHLTHVMEGSPTASPEGQSTALEVMDCSASGVAIRHSESIPPGTFLRLRMEFQTIPKMKIECLGVVVRSESRTNRPQHADDHDVGIRFTHIHEADRERIVRHIFRVQRNHLRDRQADAEAG